MNQQFSEKYEKEIKGPDPEFFNEQPTNHK